MLASEVIQAYEAFALRNFQWRVTVVAQNWHLIRIQSVMVARYS